MSTTFTQVERLMEGDHLIMEGAAVTGPPRLIDNGSTVVVLTTEGDLGFNPGEYVEVIR